jgi:crotonobetainyl-CoA:carnitine CoA-transferase CaiB-like acyl-CoA transferase
VGQHIDASKQDVLMSLVQNHICMYANLGEVHSRVRRGFLLVLPVQCQDGYIDITIVNDREWRSFAECMGNPAWADDERFGSWAGRHWWGETMINPRVQEWARQFKKDELFHMLQAKGVAAVPVATAEDLAKSAQMVDRGFFVDIEHPEAGTVRHPAAAYHLSETPWRPERAAPLLGEHNELILCQRLGFSREELARLAEAGII